MKLQGLLRVALVGSLVATTVLVAEETHTSHKLSKYTIGIGAVGGQVDPESVGGSEFADGPPFTTTGFEADFTGVALIGKVAINPNWGVMFSFRSMEDDEDLSSSVDYTQVAAQGVYLWNPHQTIRPYVKAGMVFTDLDSGISPQRVTDRREDDEGVGISFGLGLEIGSQRYAFFADFDYTDVSLFDVDHDILTATAGVLFKF